MQVKNSMCSVNIGKLFFVQMSGEQGTSIRDERRMDEISSDDQNRQYQSVTLFENTVYRLNVQTECDRQLNQDTYPCDLSQNVNVWIDFNGDGLDETESRVFPRSSSSNSISDSTYDLEINIPYIDGRNTISGAHRMRLTITPNEEYQRSCGYNDNPETREYTVNIVPKVAYAYPGKYLTIYIESEIH